MTIVEVNCSILGLPYAELQAWFKKNQLPAFRAEQAFQYLYKSFKNDWNDSSSLDKVSKELLSRDWPVNLGLIEEEEQSKDGTLRWVRKMQRNINVESVFIPSPHRNTLCLSSQVGCSLSCTFCHTGTQGFKKNLLPHEIIAQVLGAQSRLKDLDFTKKITNLVFMGQGEPLYNMK